VRRKKRKIKEQIEHKMNSMHSKASKCMFLVSWALVPRNRSAKTPVVCYKI
jgi:hypothetical protein